MVQHLIKLCVGVESIEQLVDFQAMRRTQRQAAGERDNPVHITRMMPRRGESILRGGSLYWVIKGVVQVRQSIVALERITGKDGVKRCCIVLGHSLVPTSHQPKRPFQGWRYLDESDAPKDLTQNDLAAGLPEQMQRKLRDLGAW